MTAPRPRVFVLAATGVYQAGLVCRGEAGKRGGRALVRLQGSPRPVAVHPRLLFDQRSEAVEVRGKALALGRRVPWQHKSLTDVALHVIAQGEPSLD